MIQVDVLVTRLVDALFLLLSLLFQNEIRLKMRIIMSLISGMQRNEESYDPIEEIYIDKETELFVEDFMEDLTQEHESQPQVKIVIFRSSTFENI